MHPGALVAGRFQIERLAGTGGMGSVYRALDLSTNEPVALKVMHEQARPDDVDRFEREARVLAKLAHPGIVSYVAHGAADARRFLALEWLEGEDLGSRLVRGSLAAAEALEVAVQIADALGAAHAFDVVHRDVKPTNVFLCGGRPDRCKVLDFGVAHLSASARTTSAPATASGAVIGTPRYMAPEQARGEREIGPAADVFALGCVLFECLTGRAPFDAGQLWAVLAKLLVEEAPRVSDRIPDVAPEIDAAVARLLAKTPADRPPTGAEAARVLRQASEALGSRTGRATWSRPPPALTHGEQRVFSVIFAAHGPRQRASADATTLIGSAVGKETRALAEVAAAFGARCEGLVDGSIVAVLSMTGVATDHATLAARCALAMARCAPRTRMALATGRGTDESRRLVGEVVERAAQLLDDDAADAPALRIDDATAGLLDDRFELGGDARGLVLRGEREASTGARRLLGRPTPFVGRHREVGLLMSAFEAVVGEPMARAAVITAPAGMGKSRLCMELLERVRMQEPHAEVWTGRGDALGARSPFGLLAPAVRRAAGIGGADPLDVARRKLRARVTRHVRAADVQRVAEFIGELTGVPFEDGSSLALRAARRDSAVMGDQVRAAFEDLLAAECAVHPVVILVEDLQWGDLPSVRLLDGALKNLADAPLFVLATGRPELAATFPQLWVDRPLDEIRLGELRADACTQLVRDALGDRLPPDALARIVERADGNAFYLEELIRSVVEGKDTMLPETVLAMVHARLERLDGAARRALRAASVFGQAFEIAGVAVLLGSAGDTTELRACIHELASRELVERRGGGADGLGAFAFRHSLLRDSAYSLLTDEDRVAGHALAARWLEERGERDVLVVAEHFERGREPERAARWLCRAVDAALDAHDFAGVLACAKRAVACGAVGEALGRVRRAEAEAYRWRGEFEQAADRADDAMELLARGSNTWFAAVDEAMTARGRMGRYGEALQLADEACALDATRETASAQISCLCAAARLRFHAGRYGDAERDLARIEAMLAAGAEAAPWVLAEVWRLRGARARHVGDLAGDITGYEAALAAFEQTGAFRSACNARVSLGFSHIELGDVERGGVLLEHALAQAERLGLETVATRARQNLGLVRHAQGRIDDARALLSVAIDASHAQHNLRFEGWTRVYASRVELSAGNPDGALEQARVAAELLRVTPPARAGALAAAARAHLARGEIARAIGKTREATAVLDDLGAIEEFEALVRAAHVEACLASNDRAAAEAALVKGVERLHEQARGIADERLRDSFLRSVPDNARLLALAREIAPELLRDEPPTRRHGTRTDPTIREHKRPPARVLAAYDPAAFRAAGHVVIDRLADYLERALTGASMPPVRLEDPEQTLARWPTSFGEEPSDDLASLIDRVLEGSMHVHHPRYAGHQVAAPWPVLALVETMTALLNNGMAVYESGPASTAMERGVVSFMASLLGLGPAADGVLTSGGSLGNLTALLAARQAAAARTSEPAARLAVLVSDQAHYSVERAAHVMGLGADGVVAVACDDRYAVRPDALDAAFAEAERRGRRPFAVVASAGSTATGAFDPLPAIAERCARRGVWMHVDGAHGASAALSERHRHLLAGIDRADSVVWDAHKMLGLPALVTAVLFRRGSDGYATFSQGAAYLYGEGGGPEPWWRIGARTIECTKRMMSVSLWSAFALLGTRTLGESVAACFDLARRFADKLRASGEFDVPVEPACNIVCFAHRPHGAPDVDAHQDRLRSALLASGEAYVARTVLARRGVVLRSTFMNPCATDADLDRLVDALRRAAAEALR